ncbi:MAG: TIGR03557 family F420-dependent LLM class oxidoreductase [Ilumatobacteraceae bacterium]
MEYGYTLMSEEHGPVELVGVARDAEAAGFSFVVQSDHFHPWVPEQEHSPNAWVTLGAVAQATSEVRLQTFVTCPFLRYHPAVVAQQAATLACLAEGRFTLSLGAGERLNEHVVGRGWPPVDVRHEMLAESAQVIRLLWSGGYQSFRGRHVTLEDARIFDLPDGLPPIAIAVSGGASLQIAIEHADELVATEPASELVSQFRDAKGADAIATTQLPVCFSSDASSGLETARQYFRWSALGWKVQAELPNPVNFDAASAQVRPDDLQDTIPTGPDPQPYVDAVKKMRDAGFDRLAFVQVGPDQRQFFDFWDSELRDALRELEPAGV